MRVDILLSCGKHIHDCIISFTGDAWAHKTSLTPSHFFYWSACTKPGKWAVICMYLYIRVSILPLSTTFYWLLELFRQCGVFRFNFCCFFPIILQRLRFRNYPSNTVKTEIGLSRCDWFFITLIVDSTK